MSTDVLKFESAPDWVLGLLQNHLPFSLPLLRRLQYAKWPGNAKPFAQVIFVYNSNDNNKGPGAATTFAAAYLNIAGGPDTQMWLYSTLEDDEQDASEHGAYYEEQLNALVGEVIISAKNYGGELAYPGSVLVGTLHSSVRALLERSGRITTRPTGLYDKWVFKAEELPNTDVPLPDGMHWASAAKNDYHIVISRTDIPRTVEGLSRMPSLMIKLDDGTPIVWAFLCPDGSLASLHCEPEYRRRGLATILAAKLLRERTREFGDDGWSSADVSPDNKGSRGTCLRLNGTPWWTLRWVLLDVRETEPRQTNGS